jgi:homoserine kinase
VPLPGSWLAGVVVPDLAITTERMRRALPHHVPFPDAVFNLGRAALVVRAFETADDALLKMAMVDRLHQPSRLPHIPGAETAISAAQAAGAAAALSGAGPGVIAFSTSLDVLREAVDRMEAEFRARSIGVWRWEGGISAKGCSEVTDT